MSLSRLTGFILLTIIGSLVQFFVVILLLVMKRESIDLAEILSDGSFFFFATSTVFTNFFVLFSGETRGSFDKPPFLISIFSAGFVSLMSLVCYSAATIEASQKRPLPFPKSSYLWAQLACFIVAVSYSLYTSSLCGLFAKDKPKEFSENV